MKTHEMFEAIVTLGDGSPRESVGLDDVGSCLEVLHVDLHHHVGPREREEVAVSFEVLWMVLELLACSTRNKARPTRESPSEWSSRRRDWSAKRKREGGREATGKGQTSKVGLGETEGLESRPHRPVDDQDALVDCLAQRIKNGASVGLIDGKRRLRRGLVCS